MPLAGRARRTISVWQLDRRQRGSDGVPDIIVGALSASCGDLIGCGKAHLYSGATGKRLYTFSGDQEATFFGWSVAGIGDVNGDGRGDIAVGAFLYSASEDLYEAGRVFVYSGIDSTLLWTADGLSTGEFSGSAVNAAGDVNGDGVPDVIIGAYGWNYNTGRVYVRSGLDGALLDMWVGANELDSFGRSVASFGDRNLDGYADVIIGAPNEHAAAGPSAGRQYIFLGAPTEDLNCDRTVDADDLLILISQWGECPPEALPCWPDVNHSGSVEVSDLLQMITNWSF